MSSSMPILPFSRAPPVARSGAPPVAQSGAPPAAPSAGASSSAQSAGASSSAISSASESPAAYLLTMESVSTRFDTALEVMLKEKQDMEELGTKLRSVHEDLVNKRRKIQQLSRDRDTAIHDRDTAISVLDAAIDELDTAISELGTAIGDRDTAISHLDTAINELETTIHELDTAIRDRDTAIRDRDTAIRDRDAAIQDRDAAILDRATMIRELVTVNEKYTKSVAEINQLKKDKELSIQLKNEADMKIEELQNKKADKLFFFLFFCAGFAFRAFFSSWSALGFLVEETFFNREEVETL